MPNGRKDLLLKLATRFEQKRFLPALADVRNFLERRSNATEAVHARDTGMSKVFGILITLSDDELENLIQDDIYSGPSKLGPLSDAIKARSQTLRSTKDPNTPQPSWWKGRPT